jgi:DNA helicase-2/ATP-dependent DNA helicase PcrA
VEARDEETRRKVEIYQLYEDQCQREGVVDFGELMLRSYELLRDNDPLREHYQRRFRHILVDEFQDTNKLQYAWIKMLAGPAPTARALRWATTTRASTPFAARAWATWPTSCASSGRAHQIKLEQNYRSYSNILDAANAADQPQQPAPGQEPAHRPGPGRAGARVRGHQRLCRGAVDGGGNAPAGARQRHRARPAQEIAVLYRSNAQSRVIETRCSTPAVPYRVYGGLRFFERAEIKHALAYLRLLENPHDDTSFLRVVNFPPRGIGARSIEQLQDAARASGCSLHDAVSAVTGQGRRQPGRLCGQAGCAARADPGHDAARHHRAGAAAQRPGEHYKADREGADRVENLEELVNAAESFVMQEGFGRDAVALPVDEAGPAPARAPSQSVIQGGGPVVMAPAFDAETGETLSPLAAFLTHAALEAGDNQAQAGQDAIQLMTVHSSQGAGV